MDMETIKTKERIAHVLDVKGKPKSEKNNGHAVSNGAKNKRPALMVISGGKV